MQYIWIAKLVLPVVIFGSIAFIFYDKGVKSERRDWEAKQQKFIFDSAKIQAENDKRIDTIKAKHEEILLQVFNQHNDKIKELNNSINHHKSVGLRYKSAAGTGCNSGKTETKGASVSVREVEHRLPEGIEKRLFELTRKASELQIMRNELIDICKGEVDAVQN